MCKVLSNTYCNISEHVTIMTSILEEICFFLNCCCTSFADLFYLASHSYTLITCLKFIFSIMKRSQQNQSEDWSWFQILTVAQACHKIIMTTIYTFLKKRSNHAKLHPLFPSLFVQWLIILIYSKHQRA